MMDKATRSEKHNEQNGRFQDVGQQDTAPSELANLECVQNQNELAQNKSFDQCKAKCSVLDPFTAKDPPRPADQPAMRIAA
jgi:hypothetical protein